MKIIMRVFGATVLLASAALAGCEREVGQEQELGGFETWDTDRDGFVSEEEFRSGYGRWDADRDGRISETEFGAF